MANAPKSQEFRNYQNGTNDGRPYFLLEEGQRRYILLSIGLILFYNEGRGLGL
jgi:hypothetical protein